MSVAEVAAQTKLSTTTCWRRIQQLEQNGVIKARVALLDRNALGLDVTIFAHIKLATTGRDALAEFEAAIRDRAEVLECYTLTGEWDFLLKIVTKNIKAFEAFYLDYLSRIPCVRSVNSSVAVTVIKESTALPLGILEARYQGNRMVDPVVFRASRLRCAWAASRSGSRWPMCGCTAPDATFANRSAARRVRSARVLM